MPKGRAALSPSLLKTRNCNPKKKKAMRTAITIGITWDGKSELLAGIDVSINEQKARLKAAPNNQERFAEVQIWESHAVSRRRRFKPIVGEAPEVSTPSAPPAEPPSSPETESPAEVNEVGPAATTEIAVAGEVVPEPEPVEVKPEAPAESPAKPGKPAKPAKPGKGGKGK